jgi:uncharacterized protein YjbJ (UPF0337 family)
MTKTKEAYLERIMGQINEWKAEFDKLKAKGEQASGDAKLRYSGKIDELEGKIAQAEKQMNHLREAGEKNVRELINNMEISWGEISHKFSEIRDNSESTAN